MLGGHLPHCHAHMPFNRMDEAKFRTVFVFTIILTDAVCLLLLELIPTHFMYHLIDGKFGCKGRFEKTGILQQWFSDIPLQSCD